MVENEKEGLYVVYVFADNPAEWNCSQWRCLTPANAINRAASEENNWKAKLIHVSGFLNYLDPIIQDFVGPADLIIFQRNIITERALNAMRYWRGLGKPVCVDLDDAYHMLPWSNPAHKFWFENEQFDPLKILFDGLAMSNGLVTPNIHLARDYSYLIQGYYLQNYAEPDWWMDLPDREEIKEKLGLQDRIVIGWGGSVSHFDSFWGSGILDAFKKVVQRHPEVVIQICGNDPRLFQIIDVGSSNKFHQPGVPAEHWPKVVTGFDIGVAPLWGSYDQRRSWIKGIEYSLAGVPWIGAEGMPYHQLDHMGALIPQNALAWEDALEYKIANIEEEQHNAEELIIVAQESYIVDNQLRVFDRVYKQIIADKSQFEGTLPAIFFTNRNDVEKGQNFSFVASGGKDKVFVEDATDESETTSDN